MEMNLEQRQAKFVEMFSRKAAAAAWSSEKLANLVVEATSHNGLVAFSELLAFPAFSKLAGTAESGSLDLLRLFAFGTWEDYKSNSAILPALNLKQAMKLKQLTMVNMVANKECKIVTYEQLLEKLEFADVKELECFLDLCASSGNYKFRQNKRRKNLQMKDDAEDLLPKIRGKLLCGQSFDLVLQEAATVHVDSQTGLRSNAIVKQVRVPLGGTGFLLKAEIQTVFTYLFGMLIQHVTSAHVANKSYGGKIYAGMFFVLGNQLFLRLEAAPTKRLTDENSKLDYGAVSAILKKHTRLKVSPDGAKEEFVYPIYALDLFSHLDCKDDVLSVKHQEGPMLKAQNGGYITFLRCHQTLQPTSARAASVFHIRKKHKASTGRVRKFFERACAEIKLELDVQAIHGNWLFMGVIAYARHKGIIYEENAMGCFCLIRDWETHAPEHLSEAQKLIFTAAVRNYLVEHFFQDFLPQFMYWVLTEGLFDLKVWLRKLLQVSETCTAFNMTEWNLTGFYVPLLAKDILLEQHINQFLHDMEGVRENIRDNPSYNYKLAKWRALNKLREKNVTLYYKVLLDNIQEYAPIVYMPTVRTVCQNSGCMFQRGWLMCITIQDMGMILSMMQNWLADQVDIVIVTDGSSLSGMDDLGVRAAGVAVGKLDMYVAVAGINPKRVLPVIIDIGTNCQELHDDPLYYGLQENRLNGEKYLALMDEFMDAIFSRWPSAVVEFEEFESDLALILLERYRKKHRVFNGNIEGTAAVIIAGLLGAARAQGIDMPVFPKQKIIFAVADSVGPKLEVVNATTRTIGRILKNNGTVFCSPRSGFWIVDSHGLITEESKYIDPDACPFARSKSELSQQGLGEGASLTEVVKKVKPDVIVGLSAVGGLFSKEVLEALKDSSSLRPAVFAMSNPTKNAECTPEEAFSVLGEKTIFATGGQFPDVDLGNGKIGHSNQGNNMYLFPGIGLGTLLSGARVISDGMLEAAAERLASYMKEDEVLQGIIYPPISRIRDITAEVAAAVVRKAVAEDLADGYRGMDASELAGLNEEKTIEYVKKNMWSPVYPT